MADKILVYDESKILKDLPFESFITSYDPPVGLTDYDNLTTPGYYYIPSTVTINAPTSGNFYVDVSKNQAGDRIFQAAYNEAGTQQYFRAYNGTVWSSWTTVPSSASLDGKITGPASSVNNRLVAFDGTTGKLAKDSGLLISDVSNTFETFNANNVMQPNDSITYKYDVGSTLVTNGTFTGNASGWTISGTGIAYGTNNISLTTGTGNILQSISVASGRVYKIAFTLSLPTNCAVTSGGTITVELGGNTKTITLPSYGAQSIAFEFPMICGNSNTNIKFTINATITTGPITLDNVSVAEANKRLYWALPIIAGPLGKPWSTDGYFSIACPTSGSVYESDETTVVTAPSGATMVTANGIIFGNENVYQALYYKLPLGNSANTVGKFILVKSNTSVISAKSDWVLIAKIEPTTKKIWLGTGERLFGMAKLVRLNTPFAMVATVSETPFPFDTASSDIFGGASTGLVCVACESAGYYAMTAKYNFSKSADTNIASANITIKKNGSSIAEMGGMYYNSTGSTYTQEGVQVCTDNEYCSFGDIVWMTYSIAHAYQCQVGASKCCLSIRQVL